MSKVHNENIKRLEILYKQHHNWLIACAVNITHDKLKSEELVSDLYLYLGDKPNPAIWYANSFNLQYCYAFLKTRFINKVKSEGKTVSISEDWDEVDTEYDIDFDTKIQDAYDGVVNEMKDMEKTRSWASSKLAQLYYFNEDMTLERLASEIGICKSTAFTNIKKVKLHIRNKMDNPFRKEY